MYEKSRENTQKNLETAYAEQEEIVLERTAELTEAGLRSRRLFDLASDAFFVHDTKNGKILDTNQQACKILGYTREEMLELHVSDIDVSFSPEQVCEICNTVEKDKRVVIEGRHRKKDGSIFPVEVSFGLFQEKEPTLLLSIARDISERKQAEKAMQKAHDELESRVLERTQKLQEIHKQFLHAEKLSAIGRLSACIAHEFNNPLHGVMNVISGIKKHQTLTEEYQELTDIAINECNRMKLLIRELQQFNRPSSGKNELFNMHKAIDTILLFHTKNFKNRKAKIEKKYDLSIPEIWAVQDQIKQVFINLFNNAADSMPSEGGEITISTSSHDDMIYIHVKDNGIGIKPEDKERIFEPFFTTKQAVKGTGLGLPVSYGIIKSHGGDITVTDEPGKGTTFLVSLPIDTRPYSEEKNSGS